MQERTGRSFAELLRTRMFDRAGMESALLAADTRAMPDGTEGYEGTPAGGFRAAENRILWTGDAGLGASLDDMIAWERRIDATRDDPDALYSASVTPGDLRRRELPAFYGFGLSRAERVRPHGHRPWRRIARLAQPSALRAIGTGLGRGHVQSPRRRARGCASTSSVRRLDRERPALVAAIPHPSAWLRLRTIDPESGLAVVSNRQQDKMRLRYGHHRRRAGPYNRMVGGSGAGMRLRPVGMTGFDAPPE